MMSNWHALLTSYIYDRFTIDIAKPLILVLYPETSHHWHVLIDVGLLKSADVEIKNMNEGKVGAPFQYSDIQIHR